MLPCRQGFGLVTKRGGLGFLGAPVLFIVLNPVGQFPPAASYDSKWENMGLELRRPVAK